MQIRSKCDLYFDSGDAIKTGNLGIPLRAESVWNDFATARCDASVIGNRETHVLESAFQAKVAGVEHPLLCANLERKDGSHPLDAFTICQSNGLKIGVIGVSVAMVTTKMKTRGASAFLWEPPIKVACEVYEEVAPQVDVVFALTHIGHAQDRRLAEACPGIGVIFGGHSHTVLEKPERVGSTWICQGGSHARFLGVYEWEDGLLSGGLQAWPPS